MYAPASAIRRDIAQMMRPPLRQTVTESAKRWLKVSRSGGGVEPWSADLAPYMIEPMDLLTSRRYEAVVFVGPARTGKTMAVDAWLTHAIKADPADMLIVHMTQDTARDYSRLRVDRMIRNSAEIKASMSPRASDDNTFDKFTRHGTIIKIAWPTISQLSGKEFRYAAITDLDRIADDIGGEGDVFGLTIKRLQTYLSAGTLYAESSPGREYIGPPWKASTPHEALPVSGIVGIYNRSDRRRFYWACFDCGQRFEASPGIGLFILPENEELVEMVKTLDLPKLSREFAKIACPHCGSIIQHKRKRELNAGGRWLIEGTSLSADGELIGTPRESRIAGFYLGGAAAAYQSWQSIVLNYLEALRDFTSTGSEEALKRTITQDQGDVFVPTASRKQRAAGHELQARAEYWPRLTVPDGVRFLIAAVDVQINRFVVQVIGYGKDRQRWLIDRYNISKSARESNGKTLGVSPGSYAEDWNLLAPLIDKKYPLDEDSGRQMRVLVVGCDSGGAEGVTTNAYEFWRRCRARGLSKRFRLIKGEPKQDAPRIEERFPDARGRKQRNSGAIGDVPVLFVNSNALKDALANDLSREVPGAGYFHFPSWAEAWWYAELTREQRGPKGWLPKSGNEAWDLCYYADALAMLAGMEKINWQSPPSWAAPWESNGLVSAPAEPAPAKKRPTPQQRFVQRDEGKPWIR